MSKVIHDVARDIHCDIAIINAVAMNLFYYVFSALGFPPSTKYSHYTLILIT